MITKKHIEDFLNEFKSGYKENVEAGTQGGGGALERNLGEKISNLTLDNQKEFAKDVLLVEKWKEINGELPKGFSALGKAAGLGIKEVMADYALAKQEGKGAFISEETMKDIDDMKNKMAKYLK